MKRLTCALLLFVAMPLFAATDAWWDAYQRGTTAVNARNYRAAADALQQALASNPNEGINIRTGNLLVTYVPHFWLGIAKFNLGDPDGALREWRMSEEQGAIAKTEYYARLKDWVARAQTEKQRIADNAASGPKKSAGDAISRAVLAQAAAAGAGGDRTDSYVAGLRKLQEANAQFRKAGADVDAYRGAEQIAQQASALFSTAADQAKKEKAARAAAAAAIPPKPRETAIVVPMSTPATTTTAPPPTPSPAPVVTAKPAPAQAQAPSQTSGDIQSEAEVEANVAVQQYRRHIGDAVAAARTPLQHRLLQIETREGETLRRQLAAATNDAEFQRIARAAAAREQALTKRLAELMPAPPPAPAAVAATTPASSPAATPAPALTSAPTATHASAPTATPELRDAFRAYAAGDLASSETLLTNLLAQHATAEAYLLRGIARYTRAMLSRTPDALLAQATADFRAALTQNAALRLDTNAFSPKLVSFFDRVRTGR
ncbi:MAG: hypothetical protein JO197_00590 [Acidobacteria bacterium]|nr:hypothetical protein [Acidobacteriota bacterium]MBV9476389.1 hypothetical protein [Acidobacteriota bacterium]